MSLQPSLQFSSSFAAFANIFREADETTDLRRAEVPGWPHTVIFPEGTTTNGKALIRVRHYVKQ